MESTNVTSNSWKIPNVDKKISSTGEIHIKIFQRGKEVSLPEDVWKGIAKNILLKAGGGALNCNKYKTISFSMNKGKFSVRKGSKTSDCEPGSWQARALMDIQSVVKKYSHYDEKEDEGFLLPEIDDFPEEPTSDIEEGKNEVD